ncbi:MAG: hypothetical protein CMN03_08365 [Roseibacillus sp.]|nr:hypothetical protein [Roseibacillus sp.]
MKLPLLVFSALVVLPAPPVSARPFTNAAGKTLEAEIVRATASEVTLKMTNERIATVKISSLSEGDQVYVRNWLADQIPPLRVSPNMVRKTTKDSRASYFSSSGKGYQQSYELSVDFQNDASAKGLEETTLRYFLVGRSLGKTRKHRILGVQEKDFELPPGGKHTVTFRREVNPYSESSSSSYGSYKGIGYILYATRKKDDREVYTYASTPQLEEALYSVIQLRERDVVDENFQNPEKRNTRFGRDNWNPEDIRELFDPRRRENPKPEKKPAAPPIIIR